MLSNLKKTKFIVIITILLFSNTLYAKKYVLGVFPYFNAAKLASLHKPIKDYLSISTKKQIRLVSASNFKVFKERTSVGRYDILITAPHLGRIAEKNGNYEWLGFTSNTSHAVFVVHKDSKIKSFEELKNKSIALPPKGAIIHHLALDTLKKYGINANENISLSIKKSHSNALLSAGLKNSAAAAFGAPTWAKYNAPEKDNLIKIGKSEDIPGFAILVNKNLPLEFKNELKKVLFLFENTEDGKLYFERTGLKGVRLKTDNDMKLLDKYINLMKK